MRPVPVLMYHHVNPHKGDLVTITPEVFEGQMHYLHKAGYRTLTLDELASYISGEIAVKQKAVVVTFDDGWLDNYIYAFPVLKRYNINACIFIVTAWVGNTSINNPPDSPLNLRGDERGVRVPTHKESKALIKSGRPGSVILGWEHIKEMQDSGLIEFHAHTKSHASCTTLSGHELLTELVEPKRTIERSLGKSCPYLCWPYGDYNDAALKAAKSAGYKGIFTTNPGIVKTGSDPFAIGRIVVKNSIAWFRKRMWVYNNALLSELYLRMKKK